MIVNVPEEFILKMNEELNSKCDNLGNQVQHVNDQLKALGINVAIGSVALGTQCKTESDLQHAIAAVMLGYIMKRRD